MSQFQSGDRVLLNGSLVVELESYDEENNRFIALNRVGGGTNRISDHISTNRFESLEDKSAEDTEDREPDDRRDGVHNTEGDVTDTGAPLSPGGTFSTRADSNAVQEGDQIHTFDSEL